MRLSRLREYGTLALVWIAANALPLLWLRDGGQFHWEVVEVRKLLEYGFWSRGGALVTSYAGIFLVPAAHNYVNHPYPIFWVYAFLYWLFGSAGMYALIAFGSLIGCLLTYYVLQQFFSVRCAWFTAALVATAHASIEFTTNTDVVAQGAIVWPLAGWAILRWLTPDNRSQAAPWLLGLIVFLVGQISWFALTVVPALLLWCLPPSMSLRDALRRPWAVPGWLPVILGGCASAIAFFIQVFAYSPNLGANANYLGMQMGAGGIIASRLNQLPVLSLRMVIAGPALWLGALIGLTQFRGARPEKRLVGIMLVYMLVFGLVVLAIPRLLFLNQHGFRYLIFPCAIITAYGLTYLSGKWLRVVLSLVAFGGLLFCYAKIHDYRASTASRVLGRWIGAHTQPTEFIYSNIKTLSAPIHSWDNEFVANTRLVADRLFFAETPDETALRISARLYTNEMPATVCYLQENSQAIDAALLKQLQAQATETHEAKLEVPYQPPAVFKSIRGNLWRLMGKWANQYTLKADGHTSDTNAFSITLYRLPSSFIREPWPTNPASPPQPAPN